MASPQGPRVVRPNSLTSLIPALRAFCSLLEKSKVRGMVIGGVAASLLGRPRLTADVDATILLEDAEIDRFLTLAQTCGLTSRIADPVGFARRSAMILLEHGASGVPVDVAQGQLPFERKALSRAVRWTIGDLAIRLPTPEDLVVMKAVSHRPQDIEDIRGIVSVHPKLDVRYIRKQVQEFARVMEMPELWTDISALFPRAKKPGRPARRKGLKK